MRKYKVLITINNKVRWARDLKEVSAVNKKEAEKKALKETILNDNQHSDGIKVLSIREID